MTAKKQNSNDSNSLSKPEAGTYQAPPFSSRGPCSALLLAALRRSAEESDHTLAGLEEALSTSIANSQDILRDDDLQLSLLVLHGLHYGSVVDADENWEWHPLLVASRVAIEREFERQLRERVPRVSLPDGTAEGIAASLFA